MMIDFLLHFATNLLTSGVFWFWFFICTVVSTTYLILIAQLTVDSELNNIHITFDKDEE